MIQSQSTIFLVMGKELCSCTGYSELMYRFSEGLRSCGFRWAEENSIHLLRKAWGRWDHANSPLSEADTWEKLLLCSELGNKVISGNDDVYL